MIAIRVEHPGASYDVLVGSIAEAFGRIRDLAPGRPIQLISDSRVHALHGDRLAGLALSEPILVPEGEAAKNWSVLASIIDQLAAMNVARGTPVLALGGGSVGDVAGLAASLFKRGCPIIHVPTTLLSQADSAIGGKTAIDAAGQKNLVGTFHHPALVVADPEILDTLDERQLRSGYAEVVKYGLIDDPAFFGWCEANGPALLAGDRDTRREAIEHCIRAKARFVSADPDDTRGTRALLNFGHSFGHAIEAAAGHAVLHGEAVAVGMALAFHFSVALGQCPLQDLDRVQRHLAGTGLPTKLSDVGLGGQAELLLQLMRADKKAGPIGIALVLVHGLGQAKFVRDIDETRLAAFLREVD